MKKSTITTSILLLFTLLLYSQDSKMEKIFGGVPTSHDNMEWQDKLTPDEKYIALEAQGDLFVVRNDPENPRSNHIIKHSWKDYDPIWNTDSTIIFISDRDGQEDVFQVSPADTA